MKSQENIREAFRGKYVYLRPATLDDCEIFRSWQEKMDPQRRSVYAEPVKSAEYWQEGAKSVLSSPTSTILVIASVSDDGIIGAVTYRDHNPLNRTIELEFLPDPSLRKNDLFVSGAELLITYLFESYGLNAVYTQSTVADQQTVEIIEKMNFTQEGTLRQRHYYNGAFGDVTLYSLLNYERDR